MGAKEAGEAVRGRQGGDTRREEGRGVEKDLVKAKAWYAKAAKQGNANAMNNLSGVLRVTEGDEAPRPYQAELFRAASAKGDVKAREALTIVEREARSHCWQCGTEDLPATPLLCGACKAVAYCSKKCQKKHWKKGGHKKACMERRKYLPEEE